MSTLSRHWIAGLALACGQSSGTAVPDEQDHTGTIGVETVAANLDTPWELAWCPDGRIWVSERGGTISRIDPATGAVTKAGELEVTERSESGLMGIAFHPDFESQPWVYAVHSYSSGGIRNRLVRMRWDGHALGAPEVLLSGIPGAGNHIARSTTQVAKSLPRLHARCCMVGSAAGFVLPAACRIAACSRRKCCDG